MAKKQRLSEAIWDADRSRWCCRVMVDGKRKAFYSSVPGRKGKREAERKADEWIERGAIDTRLRVGNLWERFIDYERKIRGEKNATYKQHLKYGRLYILPVVEHKKLDDMRPVDWQACILEPYAKSSEAGKPLSAKTLQNIRGALTAFRSFCEDLDIIITSMRKLRIPSSARKGERKILQPDALALLFADPAPTPTGRARKVHYLNAWRFQVLTGLRPGEVYGLRREDINPDGTITVKRSVDVDGEITSGKNFNAHRTFLPINMAKRVLEDQSAQMRANGIVSPWLFPAPDGNIGSERKSYQAWWRYCVNQGVSRCSLYELRHTMVSVNSKVPDALLKQVVGHSQNFDTRGVYNHEMQGDREQTAELIEQSFARILNFEDAKKDTKAN